MKNGQAGIVGERRTLIAGSVTGGIRLPNRGVFQNEHAEHTEEQKEHYDRF